MDKIYVKIDKLNDYAKRISDVKNRSSELEERLNYFVNIGNDFNLIGLKTNGLLTIFSRKLQNCQIYLQQTADDFKQVEETLSSYNPLKFDLAKAISNQYSSVSDIDSYLRSISDTLKISEYIEIINSDSSTVDKKDAVIKWLSSIESDAKQVKKYYEWIKNKGKVDWPEPLKSGFEFIEAIDTSNNMVSGTLGYLYGVYNKDNKIITDSGENLLDATFSVFKDIETVKPLFETSSKIAGFRNGLILSYGKNMMQNFLESIQENDKVSEVYWDVFATSGVDVFYDTVCNAPTLAIAYLPAKAISNGVGYDLEAAYAEVSDKKGFAKVTDAMGKLHREIKENSSWEDWKSGMGIMIDEVKDGIVGGFNSIKNSISDFFDNIF